MAFNIISRFIGLLLLIAAIFKLVGVAADPVARVGVFSVGWFQLLVIEFEIVLGCWLLSSINRMGAWLVSVATFAVFAGFSLYSGWIGQASCGCFGKVIVSPWWTFGFDLLTLTTLTMVRPHLGRFGSSPKSSIRSACKPIFTMTAGVAVVLGVLSFAANYAFGSIDAAIAHLRGDVVSVVPRAIDLGRRVPSEIVRFPVHLVNRTDRVVRIIGGTSDCSCTTLLDLPVTIQPLEDRTISVEVVLLEAFA